MTGNLLTGLRILMVTEREMMRMRLRQLGTRIIEQDSFIKSFLGMV